MIFTTKVMCKIFSDLAKDISLAKDLILRGDTGRRLESVKTRTKFENKSEKEVFRARQKETFSIKGCVRLPNMGADVLVSILNSIKFVSYIEKDRINSAS